MGKPSVVCDTGNMEIDETRYPTTAHYLSRLPAGLDSYPDCRVKADLHEGLRESFPRIAEDTSLPDIVRTYLQGQYDNEWLPETVGSMLVHLVRDYGFISNDAYEKWAYDNNARVFSKPHYRVLVAIFSPTLLLSGAARRWGSLHQGSTMKTEPVIRQGPTFRTASILTFPPYVFDEIDILNIASGYRVALEASQTPNPRAEATHLQRDQARFTFSWG